MSCTLPVSPPPAYLACPPPSVRALETDRAASRTVRGSRRFDPLPSAAGISRPAGNHRDLATIEMEVPRSGDRTRRAKRAAGLAHTPAPAAHPKQGVWRRSSQTLARRRQAGVPVPPDQTTALDDGQSYAPLLAVLALGGESERVGPACVHCEPPRRRRSAGRAPVRGAAVASSAASVVLRLADEGAITRSPSRLTERAWLASTTAAASISGMTAAKQRKPSVTPWWNSSRCCGRRRGRRGATASRSVVTPHAGRGVPRSETWWVRVDEVKPRPSPETRVAARAGYASTMGERAGPRNPLGGWTAAAGYALRRAARAPARRPQRRRTPPLSSFPCESGPGEAAATRAAATVAPRVSLRPAYRRPPRRALCSRSLRRPLRRARRPSRPARRPAPRAPPPRRTPAPNGSPSGATQPLRTSSAESAAARRRRRQ